MASTNSPQKSSLEDFRISCFSYQHYEYEEQSLFFMVLPLSRDEKIDLMHTFDIWYGNTDQNTDEYALELVLVMRYLLNDSALILNPKYLLLEAVLDELCDKIPEPYKAVYRETAIPVVHSRIPQEWLVES